MASERTKCEAFMNALRRHRRASGLTLEQLGNKIGVTAGAVHAWESGRWEPKPRHVPKLAKALGVSPLYLMELISPSVEPRPTAAA